MLLSKVGFYGFWSIAGLVLFGTSGCASHTTSGNQILRDLTSESLSKRLIDGKTTKKEVRAMLGPPVGINLEAKGEEIWQYHYMSTNRSGTSIPTPFGIGKGRSSQITKMLRIVFELGGGESSVIKRSTYTEAFSDKPND